ncbi:MAG: hypothetical protein LWX11_01180 [Firmicutes bacterium]|nr:hypothetical protein [Bacillota bacterium]
MLAAAIGLSAQEEGWSGALKFGGGPVSGSAKAVTGDAAFSFSPQFEATYSFNKSSAWVFGAGYRFFPGDQTMISYIPTPQVAGQTYEARIRKPEAKGLELTSLYRHTFGESFFVQGGLRIGLYKTTFRDTGSRVTYTLVSNRITPTTVVTIQDEFEKKTTSVGLLAGLGYQLNRNFSVEVNAFTVRLGNPLAGTNTSVASEVNFGIRF